MKQTICGLIVLLAIVHQDFWWWDASDVLLCGIVPIVLAYHAGISLVAGILWALVVQQPAEEADKQRPHMRFWHDTAATEARATLLNRLLSVWCFSGFVRLFPLALAALYWR